MTVSNGGRPTLIVAGASGFVGQALAPKLAGSFRLVGLTRGARGPGDAYAWRSCDLFSLMDAEKALEGAEYAIYLVHSMMPSARLTQGRFEDLDLICADNFARAARRAGVKQILYLGGLIPDVDQLSRHLESRREVERTLAGYGVPVTTLRAGLVLGANGSSFQMMLRLVQRLPLMVVPSWTSTECQPIALDDVVELVAYCMARPSTFGNTYDIGGPDVLTYREMMIQTAEALGVTRRMLNVPVLTPGLSRLWVSTITGASKELVAPLIQSLAHSMVAHDCRLQQEAGIPGLGFRASVARALEVEQAATKSPAVAASAQRPRKKASRVVRSVQRLPLPRGRDAAWVAEEYLRWLPGGMRPVRVEIEGGRVCPFYLKGIGEPLLVLSFAAERSASDRQLFYITAGLLVSDVGPDAGRGRLEMRETADGKTVITAIHDYHPRLPWLLYKNSQALVHLAVMYMFGRHLARLDSDAA